MKRCNHDHIVRLIEVIDDPRSQAVFLGMMTSLSRSLSLLALLYACRRIPSNFFE